MENVSWLWDPSRARLGLETVSRTTEEETDDESGAGPKSTFLPSANGWKNQKIYQQIYFFNHP